MPFSRLFAWIPTALGAAVAVAAAFPAWAEPVRVGGTGIAIAVFRAIAQEFMSSYPDKRVEVLPSMGSAGGMRALVDGKIGMAMVGRRLSAEEQARGLTQAACLRSPFALVTSLATTPSIASTDLAELYGDAGARWPDGRPVRIVLRDEREASVQLLIKHFPRMRESLQEARKRMDVPLATTDQENGDIAEQIAGSLTAMALTQLVGERRALRPLMIDGTVPSVEALETGAYKLAAEFCLVLPPLASPTARQFADFVLSSAGRNTARELAALVVTD